MPTNDRHVLVRLAGELSAKGRTVRRSFVDRLVHNLRDALESTGLVGTGLEATGLEATIERRWARLAVRTNRPDVAARVARRVFGVREATVAEERTWADVDQLVDRAAEAFAPSVIGRTFAVRARRGETATDLPLRTPEIERRIGAALVESSAGVDLDAPDVTARIEIEGGADGGTARLWTEHDSEVARESRLGPGGLPVGTEGRALVLFSGGFDSAVAAWRMLRRGVRVDSCIGVLGDDAQRDAVLEVARPLASWSFGYRPRLFVVDLRPIVEELKASTPPELWQVLLKRQLLRVAAPLALRRRATALVTGEAIGQVSSQTLPNLAVIERAVDLPVLRPLLTAEKHEILAEARRIGTYDPSSRVPELCALDARRPATHADLAAVESAERALDPDLPARLADARVAIDLRAWAVAPAAAASRDRLDLAVDALPPGSDPDGTDPDVVVLDLRRPALGEIHPIPGARAVDYPAVLAQPFELGPHYIAVCEIGVKSAHLAAVLTAAGHRAHHLRGGSATLRREPVDPLLLAASTPATRD